ncbi:hypothetical protein [Pseudoroseicyclus tamaricis]|uniref:Uncharacterized protein n=1 Tax=Pseudoroseicyclus tamaricis TaxID=2705421 RepID=A0A6B2JGV7_9RHOB|nr:hypothetical protein [Pseudoroseicyclus tamaricis]NDV00451.1 hypothetical protein [Pseudoroseicyclus tamaricis]
MSTYKLTIYELDSAAPRSEHGANVEDIIARNPSGYQWDWGCWSGLTLSIRGEALPIQAEVDDPDAGVAGAQLNDDHFCQVLRAPEQTSPTVIEIVYEATLANPASP